MTVVVLGMLIVEVAALIICSTFSDKKKSLKNSLYIIFNLTLDLRVVAMFEIFSF